MGVFGYADDEGRCPVFDGRGGIREILANYEACGESALDEEEPVSEHATRTVDAEVLDRMATYQRLHPGTDGRRALQKVLDADPALAAAYTNRPVPLRAGPSRARAHTHGGDAAAAKETLRALIAERVKDAPEDVLRELLQQEAFREQILPAILELIAE